MKMNIVLRSIAALMMVAVLVTSCKDKDAERRIAELERENSALRAKKVETQSPVTTPVAEEKPEGPVAAITFKHQDFDFGTIKEGQVVEHTFELVNNGTVPLLISEARPSCGCTVQDWTKEPIPAGGKG